MTTSRLSRWSVTTGAVLCLCAPAGAQQVEPAQQPSPALPDELRMPEADAKAQRPDAPPGSLRALVSALDDESFQQRELATDALRERAVELETAVAEGDIDAGALSPEQRMRVADVLETHFYDTPRAGLGVQFQQMNPAGNGIALQMVLGEFPASRVLRAGDAILLADGRDISDMPSMAAMELLRAMIIARDPGDTLPMTVQRGAIEVELDVELGDFRNLGNGNRVPQESDLINAWELRQRELGLGQRYDGRIDTALSRRDWPNIRRQQRIDPDASIFAAGTSQTANIHLLAWSLPARQRAKDPNQRNARLRIQQDRERPLAERRVELLAQIEQLQLLAQVTEQRANDINAGEAQRRGAAMRLVQIRARIAELRQDLERLERR